ncbi:hypothetical protein CI109_103379 [Kwoniella shandongensis]|uniref:Uncharacterized protein n=1 Tax=Kwoniella shandongensis TaxID=1734106 RepID=A0A5M6BWB1_9TREE|nr:uncharacterized protein CI109_004460 [Kwoniella shandongensis]KAA5527168.1 hypothetical protein CI109_004460 [Kwoniella shandongensis]
MPAPTMSQLDQTSAILGEYMLKGWTLTDLHCSDCRSTPLMREPAAIAQREGRERIQFCALCDGRPEGRVLAPTTAPTSAPPAQRSIPSTSTSLASTSTPAPAQTSNGLSQQDRAQSDDAVSSISTLLLKGYALLGENCPNPTCRGIPLVGYPRRPDGSKDGRKMCVACDGRWVAESSIESGGMKVVAPDAGVGAESPRSKRRRELYGLVVEEQGKGKEKVVESHDFQKRAKESEDQLVGGTKSALIEEEDEDNFDEDDVESPALNKPKPSTSQSHPSQSSRSPDLDSPLGLALSNTSSSLATTLQNLSSSLERYASHPPTGQGLRGEEDSGKWFVDLKLHTEAIKDVLGVIGQVEQARKVGY